MLREDGSWRLCLTDDGRRFENAEKGIGNGDSAHGINTTREL